MRILHSSDFVKIALVCLAIFSMAACVGVAGNPSGSNSGSGLAILDVTPLSINFGTVAAGGSAQQTVDIANTGTKSAKVTKITMKGNAFSVKGISVPLTIKAGDSANFIADFAPGSTGLASGSISLVTDAKAAPIVIGLAGTGGGTTIAVTPSSASFGDVAVGSDATQSMELKVSGDARIKISKISTIGTGFSVSGLAVPLALSPGQTALFLVSFKPSTTGTRSGEISITSTADDSPLTVNLGGKGASRVAGLSVTPTALSFGSVTLGTSATKEITLKSTGNANADISSVSVAGSGFSVSGGGSNIALTPGQELTLVTKFDPSKSGTASATITIASNVPNSPAKISLAGSAQASNEMVQHKVTLRWEPSTSPRVVGYYVYRGLLAAGPFSKLNSVSDASATFTDASVFAGQTYYYVVTAVDSGHVESPFSNPVIVTIP